MARLSLPSTHTSTSTESGKSSDQSLLCGQVAHHEDDLKESKASEGEARHSASLYLTYGPTSSSTFSPFLFPQVRLRSLCGLGRGNQNPATQGPRFNVALQVDGS